MQSKNILRLLRALARQGLDVQYNNQSYSVRWVYSPDAPIAEVLLPEGFPVEIKAFKQLANLATAKHPTGGHICRVCATPDFHPGDAGVVIGTRSFSCDRLCCRNIWTSNSCSCRIGYQLWDAVTCCGFVCWRIFSTARSVC